MMYVVTKSRHYPNSGTEDWVLCTPNGELASARFYEERAAAYREDSDPVSVANRHEVGSLVEIAPDGTYKTIMAWGDLAPRMSTTTIHPTGGEPYTITTPQERLA